MKFFSASLLVVSLLAASVSAQVTPPPAAPPPPPPGVEPAQPAADAAPALFTAEQLDQLLGPIALYPDALVAIILPASTNSADVVLAARFLEAGGLPAQADLQPWDDSVRALAHYPQLVRWMDQNLAWTKQLGDAFAEQPNDVMAAIQRLRERAKAAGTLQDNAQQEVVEDNGSILIVPTDPNIIYIPYYDPTLVYGGGLLPYSTGTYFSYSVGFNTGWWLCYGFDWRHHRVWSVNHRDRERFWREHQRDWHRFTPPQNHAREVHVWRPRSDYHASRPGWQRPAAGRANWPAIHHSHEGGHPAHDAGAHWRRPNGATQTASVAPGVVGPTVRAPEHPVTSPVNPTTPAFTHRHPGSRFVPPGAAGGRPPGTRPGFTPPPNGFSHPAPGFHPNRPFVPLQHHAAPGPRPAPPLHVAPSPGLRVAPPLHVAPPPAAAPAPNPGPQHAYGGGNPRPHGRDRER